MIDFMTNTIRITPKEQALLALLARIVWEHRRSRNRRDVSSYGLLARRERQRRLEEDTLICDAFDYITEGLYEGALIRLDQAGIDPAALKAAISLLEEPKGTPDAP